MAAACSVAAIASGAAACAPSTAVSPTQTAPRPTGAQRPGAPTGSAPRVPPTTAPTTALSTAPTAAPSTAAPAPAPTTATSAPGPTTATSAPAPTAAQGAAGVAALPGRYPVVTGTVTLVDTTRPTVSGTRTIAPARTLTTLVWRPAISGRRPLIVFAHGFNTGPGTYDALLTAWASAGYVVAAPEFPLTDPAVAGANLDENDLQNQPADLRFVTDALVDPAAPLSADIDASRVVFGGHSDGGETALAAGLAAPPIGEPLPRAVLAMSVSPLVDGATITNPPLLVTQGDADPINAPARGRQVFDEAAPPKWYMDLLGGGHLPPLLGGSAWLPTIEAATLAFFHLYLFGGDPSSVLVAGNHAGVATIAPG